MELWQGFARPRTRGRLNSVANRLAVGHVRPDPDGLAALRHDRFGGGPRPSLLEINGRDRASKAPGCARHDRHPVAGANGPAALANLITLGEQNVDWIVDAIEHLRREGHATMEPSAEGQQSWMDTVFSLAEQTLVSKANTWYTGGNIAGKPRGLSMYTGGYQRYVEACRQAAGSYPLFAFGTAQARAFGPYAG